MTFSALKQQFETDFGPRREDDFGLRVIRSIRWGMRAETAMVAKDHDAAFIFYWIAFNAAYSEYHEQTSRERERRLFEVFLGKIFAFDGDRTIGNAMSQRLQSRIERFRNQLLHGGATWNSSTNRRQVVDGANIMGVITPIIVGIMLDRPDESWGIRIIPS